MKKGSSRPVRARKSPFRQRTQAITYTGSPPSPISVGEPPGTFRNRSPTDSLSDSRSFSIPGTSTGSREEARAPTARSPVGEPARAGAPNNRLPAAEHIPQPGAEQRIRAPGLHKRASVRGDTPRAVRLQNPKKGPLLRASGHPRERASPKAPGRSTTRKRPISFFSSFSPPKRTVKTNTSLPGPPRLTYFMKSRKVSQGLPPYRTTHIGGYGLQKIPCPLSEKSQMRPGGPA